MSKLNESQYLEAADRCSAINDIIQVVLLKHPVFQHPQHVQWADRVIDVQQNIAKLYLDISAHEND